MKMLIISAVFLVTNLSFAPLSVENINTREAVFRVDGMTCGMCALSIKIALKRLDGVEDADVSYKDEKAKVRYENDKVTVDEMIKAIENAGNYKVNVIENVGENQSS